MAGQPGRRKNKGFDLPTAPLRCQNLSFLPRTVLELVGRSVFVGRKPLLLEQQDGEKAIRVQWALVQAKLTGRPAEVRRWLLNLDGAKTKVLTCPPLRSGVKTFLFYQGQSWNWSVGRYLLVENRCFGATRRRKANLGAMGASSSKVTGRPEPAEAGQPGGAKTKVLTCPPLRSGVKTFLFYQGQSWNWSVGRYLLVENRCCWSNKTEKTQFGCNGRLFKQS